MDPIIINGTAHDFGSVEIEVDSGLALISVLSIDYSDEMNGETVYGANAQAIARTRGQYSATGSLKLTKRGAVTLAAKLGTGTYDKTFNLKVKYNDTDKGGVIIDELRGVRLGGRGNAHSAGATALETSLPIKVSLIIWNGVNPIEDMVI